MSVNHQLVWLLPKVYWFGMVDKKYLEILNIIKETHVFIVLDQK